ncbi:MAG: PspC domain-containing protein [Bacteroidales bacterium]|nr:PspC domain-containing protein [Bacteroidales bacterium]
MKKNIKVNVAGMLFNIDEDAYEMLENYLNRLDRHFSRTNGSKEIIEDIERGIADMMSNRVNSTKTTINLDDIQEIIKAMGEPGEIDDEEENNYSHSTSSRINAPRRLYRDSDMKVIAGVCSGISKYLNVDVAWIRILFVVLLFISGTGLLIYLVLWIAVPEAITTAQKLEMQGEPINIDNIEKKIKEEVNNLGDQITKIKKEHFTKKKSETNTPRRNQPSVLGSMIAALVKVVLVFFGLFFGILALIVIGFTIPAFVTAGGSLFFILGDLVYFSIPEVLRSITVNNSEYHMVFLPLIAIIFIPLISLILGSLGYLFGFRSEAKGINKALGILWIVAVVFSVVSFFQIKNHFEHDTVVKNQITLNVNDSTKTLYLRIAPSLMNLPDLDDDFATIYDEFDGDFMVIKTDSTYYAAPKFRSYFTSDSNFRIETVMKSHGEKPSIASKNVRNIDYKIVTKDSVIYFSPLFSFPSQDRFRNQQVEIRLYVPKNKSIIIEENPELTSQLYKEIERELGYSIP